MYRDLNPDLVEHLYKRDIRYSVMELTLFGWIYSMPDPVQGPSMAGVKGLAAATINTKVDLSINISWGEGGYDNTNIVQARATSQSPILLHHVMGEPT